MNAWKSALQDIIRGSHHDTAGFLNLSEAEGSSLGKMRLTAVRNVSRRGLAVIHVGSFGTTGGAMLKMVDTYYHRSSSPPILPEEQMDIHEMDQSSQLLASSSDSTSAPPSPTPHLHPSLTIASKQALNSIALETRAHPTALLLDHRWKVELFVVSRENCGATPRPTLGMQL